MEKFFNLLGIFFTIPLVFNFYFLYILFKIMKKSIALRWLKISFFSTIGVSATSLYILLFTRDPSSNLKLNHIIISFNGVFSFVALMSTTNFFFYFLYDSKYKKIISYIIFIPIISFLLMSKVKLCNFVICNT